jgi:hypothetical protein
MVARSYKRRVQSGGFYPSVMANLLKSGSMFITPCIINAVKLFKRNKTRRSRRR